LERVTKTTRRKTNGENDKGKGDRTSDSQTGRHMKTERQQKSRKKECVDLLVERKMSRRRDRLT